LSSESRFTAVQKKCDTPPHVHPMSRYVIARDQFTGLNESTEVHTSPILAKACPLQHHLVL